MSFRRIGSLAAVCVLALAGSALADMKIAIANPVAIFDQMKERKTAEDQMRAEAKNLQDQLEAEKGRIEMLQKGLNEFAPGSQEYQNRERQIMADAIALDTKAKLAQVELNKRQMMLILNLFNKIQAAIEAEAKAQQIDLVITDARPELPKPEQLATVKLDELRARMLGRSVMYAGPKAIDITSAVTLRINSDATTKPAVP